jgi:hypothetical protein
VQVERTNWGKLFGRQQPSQPTAEEIKDNLSPAEEIDHPQNVALENDFFEPPGELMAFTTSVSKLTVSTIKKTNPWSVFWLVLISLTSGIGALSLILLTGVPAQPDCSKISVLSTDSEKLHCNKVFASGNDRTKVLAAIDLVRDWGTNHPLANDGKTQLDLWSRQLIRLSKRELASDGDINKAVENLQRIPSNSAAYVDAQSSIEKWEKQWSKGAENERSFQAALQKAKWFDASLYLSRMGTLPSSYWSRTRYDAMSAQLTQEQDGWERYQEAESLALTGDLDDYKRKSFRQFTKGKRPQEKVLPSLYTDDAPALAKAIAISNAVKPNTYIHAQVKAKREIWNQRLVDIAAEKYRDKDFAGAIAAAKLVSKNSAAYAQAQKWQKLSGSTIAPTETTEARSPEVKSPNSKSRTPEIRTQPPVN